MGHGIVELIKIKDWIPPFPPPTFCYWAVRKENSLLFVSVSAPPTPPPQKVEHSGGG